MTLRNRVLLGLGFVAIVLAILGSRRVQTTEANLIRQVDDQLERTGPRLRPGELGDGAGPNPYFVAVLVDGDLQVVAEAQTTRAEPGRPELDVTIALAHLDEPAFTVNATGTNVRYRFRVRTAIQPSRERVVIAYGAPLEDVDLAVGRLIATELLGFGATMAALGMVGFWVVRLGIRPIKQMTTAASAMGAGDLSQRIPPAAAGTEAAELGVALNRMLGQIEAELAARTASEERLRRFVADASHELRTPLTTISGYAELYRMGGLSDREQLGEAMARTEAEARRMSGLVEDLLRLARLDEDRPLELTEVDLAVLVDDTARDARAVEPDRPVTVMADGPVVVRADEARMRQVLANLVGNVRVHTPPATPVALRLSTDAGAAVIQVVDSGPGMDPADAKRAFERFYRADASRVRATGGSGLGLAIVAAEVAAHRGQVGIDPTPGGGVTVTVRLPLPPTEQQQVAAG